MKNYVHVKKDFDADRFTYLKNEVLMGDLVKLITDSIKQYNSSTTTNLKDDIIKNYSLKLLSIFRNFYNEFPMDFEFSMEDFKDIIELNLNIRDSFLIYEIIYNAIETDDFNLIKIFYSNLLEFGPFCHDVESIDMEKDLLRLMTDEIKELFFYYDEFFINKDKYSEEELIVSIRQLKYLFRDDSVPFFLVYYMADFFVYDLFEYAVCDELTCEALSLYVVAADKIYKKPVLTPNDISNSASVRESLDSSGFDDNLVEKTFQRLNKNCWYSK